MGRVRTAAVGLLARGDVISTDHARVQRLLHLLELSVAKRATTEVKYEGKELGVGRGRFDQGCIGFELHSGTQRFAHDQADQRFPATAHRRARPRLWVLTLAIRNQ